MASGYVEKKIRRLIELGERKINKILKNNIEIGNLV